MTNPDWTRDELILALDLYFREPAARGSASHPECIKLSQLLNSLPIHVAQTHDKTFRNANSVGMKLRNFLKYDSGYNGKGLRAGSHHEKEVWATFADNLSRLAQAAELIRFGAKELSEISSAIDEERMTRPKKVEFSW
jgi:5-methylcytosine-specific restriction protein A